MTQYKISLQHKIDKQQKALKRKWKAKGTQLKHVISIITTLIWF